jgi:AraC family transcriptional regulator of adaptative response/methylated-DNA-[protein]-cysteine methyltransferase
MISAKDERSGGAVAASVGQVRGSMEALSTSSAPFSLGHLLVAATSQGVRVVLLGDTPEALARDLQAYLPTTPLRAAADASLIQRVIANIEAPHEAPPVPLDLHGTAFQLRVWRALMSIPIGVTSTYTALAHTLGAPRAVRAVAGACAANRVAVLVPCHRVIRTDGTLSGYRWGVHRKQALLARERQST